jgi:hypothetical protein
MRYLLASILLLALALQSCRRDDEYITESSAQLEFSTDTLRFDTVFTTLGSATRSIKVYNTHKQPILIDKVYFEKGGNTKFRMNVDGLPGAVIEEVEVPAKDSIYIFMEVTIDPNDIDNPFVIHENLLLETNGKLQKVVLEAWGQNANYIPNQFNNGGVAQLTCSGGEVIWDDPKPYVIFGALVIDDCRLVIKEGTQVYVHGGLESFLTEVDGDTIRQFYNDGRIFTTASGSLRIEGTFENPVIIQGDRLESSFQEVAGQWFGIVLSAGSEGNFFNYVTIKNSVLGVAVDSTSQATFNFSTIHNTTAAGLYGINADISAQNCLLYDNGGGGVVLLEGGSYVFDYCTIANYGTDSDALSFSDVLCFGNPIPCSQFYSNHLFARFNNCIISGSRADEISPLHLDVDVTSFDYLFNNCLVKIDEILDEGDYTDFLNFCNDCVIIQNSDALFVDESDGDYHLDTLSIAEGKAMALPAFPVDLDNVMRDGLAPDVGCFEYVYE